MVLPRSGSKVWVIRCEPLNSTLMSVGLVTWSFGGADTVTLTPDTRTRNSLTKIDRLVVGVWQMHGGASTLGAGSTLVCRRVPAVGDGAGCGCPLPRLVGAFSVVTLATFAPDADTRGAAAWWPGRVANHAPAPATTAAATTARSNTFILIFATMAATV